jgi:hypothetical protein
LLRKHRQVISTCGDYLRLAKATMARRRSCSSWTLFARSFGSSSAKGSIADQSGFSPQDPVDVLKIQVTKEKDALFAEVYTKKRKNGYFDVSISIGAPLDSPNYF